MTLEELSLSCDDEEALRTIAENACAEGETIHNLAGDVTPDELYAAIIAADAMGKEAKQR